MFSNKLGVAKTFSVSKSGLEEAQIDLDIPIPMLAVVM